MQRSYVTAEVTHIPNCDGRYTITLEGIIREVGHGIIPTIKRDGEQPFAYLDLWNGLDEYPLAIIMAFTFKPHHLPEKYWGLLNVGFIDGDVSNYHPGNLVWLYPEGGLEYEAMPGFKYVPGFTRYAIDSSGSLFSINRNKFRTPITATNGYITYKLKPDVGDKDYTTGRHRLVGLAWLKYPPHVDQLQINHINTIPGDDWLDNLEWSTQIQNMQHAKHHELLTYAKPTLVRNARSGDVFRYPSVADAAIAVGVTGNTLANRMKLEGQHLYPGDLQFKFEDDPTPWRTVSEEETYTRRGTVPVALLALDTKTNRVSRFNGIKVAATELGIDSARIWHCLNTPRLYNREVKGYIFHLDSDERPWPI